MKLVLKYLHNRDCDFEEKKIVCFNFSSKENALDIFNTRLIESFENKIKQFEFCNYLFDVSDFYPEISYGAVIKDLPKIFTLEEWFDNEIKE